MTFQYCFDGSIKKVNNLSVSSPRTWGCFSLHDENERRVMVFPTHVGVFLQCKVLPAPSIRLPHARGGVSAPKRTKKQHFLSSPRTWGCFHESLPGLRSGEVFPTHVGVFPFFGKSPKNPKSLPHARGGVSAMRRSFSAAVRSSPRTWGCFRKALTARASTLVFPTHVGVFPGYARGHFGASGLPHARGGVSMRPSCRGRSPWSSPRTWGCFYFCMSSQYVVGVFPTHVGVFLLEALPPVQMQRLPHARGGVSP